MFTERFIHKCSDCIIFNRKPNVGPSCDRGKSSFDQDNCLVNLDERNQSSSLLCKFVITCVRPFYLQTPSPKIA